MLGSGYWWGAHDARHAVYFLFEFDRAIQDGVLWPRWAPDFAFGYGYPFFNIYGPLTAYIGEGFHLLGLELVGAVKATFALSVPLSGLAMAAFVRRLFGSRAGLVAGAAYLFLPYHLADLYVRAALAESWAFVWFPLVFWGFWECVVAPRARAVALTATAYALFFLTHPGLVIQATVVLAAWCALWLLAPLRPEGQWFWKARAEWIRRARGAGAALGAIGLGGMLGAIFVLPWLLESRFVNTDQWFEGYFSYTNHFVGLWQVLSPFWGFGTSVAGTADTFPFQLGLVPLLLAAVAWVVPLADERERLARRFFSAMLLWFCFLMLEASRPLWVSPLGDLLFKPMQFPWRFLILAGFALAGLAGVAARHLSWRGASVFCALLVVGAYPYLGAERIEAAEGEVGFAGLMRFQQSAAELTGQSACVRREDIPQWSPLADLWVSGTDVQSRFDYSLIGDGSWAGNPIQRTTQEVTEVLLETPQTVRWLITDYPGWRAYRLPLDGEQVLEELPITPAPRTCHLTVQAPAGHYRLLVRFEDTPVRVIGRWLSVAGLLVTAVLWMRGRAR